LFTLPPGEDLSPRSVGELAVRGPQMMVGYWGMGDETRSRHQGRLAVHRRCATMDEDGYFRIISRRRK